MTEIKVIRRRAQMRASAQSWRQRGLTLGLVPTMGALHEGHASLIRRARRENDRVIVSIFVNPTQFGPNEDFARYPRSLSKDKKLCAETGATVIYAPSIHEVYPHNFQTSVQLTGLSRLLCGHFRPGHFSGVATIVLKLFETMTPDCAYFGEKDYQQLTIVRRMVADLDLPVTVVPCPIVREHDGLALSSRNRYLTAAERALAPALYAGLRAGALAARERGAQPSAVVAAARRIISRMPGTTIDYVSLVDAATLLDASALKGKLRLLAAVRLGATRLIDNISVPC